MAKAKTKSKAPPSKKTKKPAKLIAQRAARAVTRGTTEPPQTLLRTPDRNGFSMPFLVWANAPFAMMDMWFDVYAPKRDRV